jgi:hypothetical protein
MFLYTRRATLKNGNTRKAMDFALKITEKANKVSGLDISLFSEVYSPNTGTLVWSAFVADLATLEAGTDKLQADDAFVKLLDDGAAFVQDGVADGLSMVVAGTPDPNRTVNYATVVQSACSNGNIGRGIEVGIEIAQRAEKITGTPTLFTATMTGPYSGVAWITGQADIQSVEAAQTALAADASFGEYIDHDAGGVYTDDENLTTSTLYRRIA